MDNKVESFKLTKEMKNFQKGHKKLMQARKMIEALEEVGASPASHFQPGAGHWWDGDAAPGADCLTWPAIYELFGRHRRETAPTEIRFTNALPKTRSGKIMRRLLRDIASGREVAGDTSTLEDFSVLAKLRESDED